MAEHPCTDCRFAEWKRTAAGRLHPSGSGKCTWTVELALPASFGDREADQMRRDLARPRYIERGGWPTGECAVKEPA